MRSIAYAAMIPNMRLSANAKSALRLGCGEIGAPDGRARSSWTTSPLGSALSVSSWLICAPRVRRSSRVAREVPSPARVLCAAASASSVS